MFWKPALNQTVVTIRDGLGHGGRFEKDRIVAELQHDPTGTPIDKNTYAIITDMFPVIIKLRFQN